MTPLTIDYLIAEGWKEDFNIATQVRLSKQIGNIRYAVIWFSMNNELSFGIYGNIPYPTEIIEFVALYIKSQERFDKLWLAITEKD